MSNYMETYKQWCTDPYFDADTKAELKKIEGDQAEIEDRFYRQLEFGTGGLRGVIGAGTNRMNIYTVRQATQGLANYIISQNGQEKGVAIAHDSRIMSPEFTEEAALCLNANGIKAYVFDSLRPTPELSFAVRELGCISGIVITASHNPREYNGYKVYGEDGAQMSPESTDKVVEFIDKTPYFGICEENADITADNVKGLDNVLVAPHITVIGKSVDNAYFDTISKLSLSPAAVEKFGKNVKIVYTPIHGSGYIPVTTILSRMGITVNVVKEQALPDTEFSTVRVPNPEEADTLRLGVKLADEIGSDVVIGTDPDADRMGIAIRDDNGKFVLLNGNQIGVLLADYIFRRKTEENTMPQNGALVKTIVTTELARKVATSYGVTTFDVLTGFKFIGEKIKEWEENGKYTYLFGFEESYGYLAGSYVRDKDAVVASMLICEMAAFYRSQGISLVQARAKMYSDYGFYCNKLDTFTFEGETGMKKMNAIMDTLRNEKLEAVAGLKVIGKADYKLSVKTDYESGKTEELTLPKSNVITFYLEDNASVVIRPSGTEPKIKLYYTTVGTSVEDAAEKQVKLSADFTKIVG